MVKLAMSCDCAKASPQDYLPPFSNDPVSGLQGAIAAFTIMPCENENRFRFSHDRYLQAAYALTDQYSRDEMHYVLACAMMKHDPYESTRPSKVSTKVMGSRTVGPPNVQYNGVPFLGRGSAL